MKYSLLILILVFISHSLFSQKDETEDFYFSTVEEEISLLIEKARDLGTSDPAEQLILATEAYNLAIDEDSLFNMINALGTQGLAYFQLQEYDKCLQVLMESYELSRKIDYKEGQWYSLYHLGILHRSLDDTEKAIGYFEEADTMFIEKNDIKHISVYRELAKLYKQQEMYERAITLATSASEIALSLNDLESVLSLSLLMGEIHYIAGDIRRANNLFKSIVSKTSAFGQYQNLRATAMSYIGKCYALLGDYHLALANGQDSLLLSAKNDSVAGRVDAYDSLAFIYSSMGDFEQAYKNLQLYFKQKAILDEMDNRSNLNKIKAYYETFEKEQEIDKQQLQIENQNRLILTGSLMIAIFVVLILVLYLLYRRNSRIAVKLNRELKQEMEFSRTDHVTGLPNRKYVEDSIHKAIVNWKKENAVFSLIFLSFESLKKIDKEMGEKTGEEIQKFISKILKTELKGQDVISLWKPFLFLLVLPETDNINLKSVKIRLESKFEKETFTKGEKEIDLIHKIGSFSYTGKGNRSFCIERCREDLESI